MDKLPRADSTREQTATLVRAFLASATSAFGTLVADRDASWAVYVQHSTRTGIVPVAPEAISGFFFATGAFTTSQVTGKITYGDRELYINTVLGPSASS